MAKHQVSVVAGSGDASNTSTWCCSYMGGRFKEGVVQRWQGFALI